jgi:hypothetical protein
MKQRRERVNKRLKAMRASAAAGQYLLDVVHGRAPKAPGGRAVALPCSCGVAVGAMHARVDACMGR